MCKSLFFPFPALWFSTWLRTSITLRLASLGLFSASQGLQENSYRPGVGACAQVCAMPFSAPSLSPSSLTRPPAFSLSATPLSFTADFFLSFFRCLKNHAFEASLFLVGIEPLPAASTSACTGPGATNRLNIFTYLIV